ncbi:MAG: Hsp20/alpha crystallin family protein [Actinobacteria bacterium]|nr:Hsp20/alpha crystallin family protein [Actinomycetota bacterium]
MRALLRYDPFSVARDLDQFFEGFGTPVDRPWIPRVDVFDREDALIVRTELPGMRSEDIDVTIENSELVISGSRSFDQEEEGKGYHRREIAHGEFQRAIYLPDEYDADKISAAYRDGILEISIPKRPEVLPKKVKVDIAD